MFFTVFGSNSPRIESAALDGSNRQVVIGEKVVYPVGLTLDLANHYIYWIGITKNYHLFNYYDILIKTQMLHFVLDTYLDVIERATYNGAKRKTVKKGLLVIFGF